MRKVLIVLFIFLNSLSYGQLIKDESYLDKDFVVFKAKLTLAINNKDSLALSKLLANKIYGPKDECPKDGFSKEEFFKYYSVRSNEFWDELATIVRFGFKRKDLTLSHHIPKKVEGFQAPSYLDEFDYENTLLILGENVNIRKKPSIRSEILTKISFDTLNCKCGTTNMTQESFVEADNFRWVHVKLKDGRFGYVAEKLTSNIISTEISVIKINGEWKIKSISLTMYC